MKTDMQLKRHVEEELKWEPSVNEARIGVAVKDGVVTLTGYVNSYPEKWAAERAVKRLKDVKAIAEEIEVELLGGNRRTDGDIARAAANTIEWNTLIPRDRIKVMVHDGWVTLEGEVEWWYQKDAAENSVRNLSGVRGVANKITITPALSVEHVDAEITKAFQRNAMLDARKIWAETQGTRVILHGKARTWLERKEAEEGAWAAPGVTGVEDLITIAD